MRPVSLKHLLTKPALLIAAGLVLLGATSGRAAPMGDFAVSEGERGCRATKPSFDTLYRCLTASFVSDDTGGFAHVGLDAAFDPVTGCVAGAASGRLGRTAGGVVAPRTRLRCCPVGPSPPR